MLMLLHNSDINKKSSSTTRGECFTIIWSVSKIDIQLEREAKKEERVEKRRLKQKNYPKKSTFFAQLWHRQESISASNAGSNGQSGSFNLLKSTRKLCSGTTQRKPRSAPLTYGPMPCTKILIIIKKITLQLNILVTISNKAVLRRHASTNS